MAAHNRTLKLLASKLGLDDDKILGKAAEFERLLQTKSVAGSNLSDTSKSVICLDLASGLFGADLDLKTAIKYSGLKSSTYANSKKVIQNLLELQDNLTSSVLCAALQCTGVQELADKILDDYRNQSKMAIDLRLPHYICMAVYQACRINRVKVSKSKLIEKSRLKPAQWAKLDAEWTKFVDQHFTVVKKKRGKAAKAADDVAKPEQMDIDLPKKQDSQEPQIESYEEWKNRILQTAYKELKELEVIEQKMEAKELTPRRSPRKTPQKFSPYKSPGKTKMRILKKMTSSGTDATTKVVKKPDMSIQLSKEQLEKILTKMESSPPPAAPGSFTNCQYSYDGRRNSDIVK